MEQFTVNFRITAWEAAAITDELKVNLFFNIDSHICNDSKPSLYLNSLNDTLFLTAHPFTMVSCLKDVMQSPKHHPEGSVWNHTMLVIDEAAARKLKSTCSREFMWAALLHDIGKAVTTKMRKGRLTAYNHDIAGAEMVKEFLHGFESTVFIKNVSALVRWHMQILYFEKSVGFADIAAMKREVNVNDMALLGLCDRLGRSSVNRRKEEQSINEFLRRVIENEQ